MEKYDVKPVILIRHPVAVVASFLRLGWQGNLAAICQQRQLIEDYFLDDQHLLFEKQREPLERIAVLWRALNKVTGSRILMENYEWTLGMEPHFGLAAVDRNTQERRSRPCVEDLQRICRQNSLRIRP